MDLLDFKGVIFWYKMYVHASKIVYRAFKREAFNVEIAKSIHSHLRKRWEAFKIKLKPRRGDRRFLFAPAIVNQEGSQKA